MIEDANIAVDLCEELRQSYQHTDGLSKLQDEFDLDIDTIRYHLYGDCDHTTEVDAVTPPVEHRVSAEDCRRYRQRVNEGESPRTLAEEVRTGWRTLVKHLAGECRHDIEVPSLELEELYRRNRDVDAEDCAKFRRSYHEAERDVLSIAEDTGYSYGTILRHVNGNCSHDTDVEPRSTLQRGENIDLKKCKEMRERWFDEPNLSLDSLGEEFGVSKQTAESHVKFKCPHPQWETLADEMQEFDDILSDPEPDGLDREAILDVSSADVDMQEAASDVVAPKSNGATISRVVRNTETILDLKDAYNYKCQICEQTVYRDGEEPYAEGHHLRPISPPHNGPDVPANVVVLCPTHHAEFDYGVIAIDPETCDIRHVRDETLDGRTLTTIDQHSLGEKYLQYHLEEISEIEA